MLVLSRCEGERLRIGENIVITLVAIKGATARIGIEAPQDVVVLREEVALRDKENGDEGA